ncbi:MAG: hypothetical protein JWR00_2552 [Rubritepida sp.]|nr:hypothetical protein [Rubritepida sp.]
MDDAEREMPMFGTGIIAKLRRKARAIDIVELSRELEECRIASLNLAAEHFVLKSVVATLIDQRPEFRSELQKLLAGRLIEGSHPLSTRVGSAAQEWRELVE